MYIEAIAVREEAYQAVRKDSIPCADQDELCSCPVGGTVYYGARDEQEFMFNGTTDIDLWLNHTIRSWDYRAVIPCTSEFIGKNPLLTNEKHCYCFSNETTQADQGYFSEYLRLKPLPDGFQKVNEYPNLKQQAEEF